MRAVSMQGRKWFLLLAMMLLPCEVYAAAWLQEKGKGLSIRTLSLYYAPSYYDGDGNQRSQNSFTQFALDNFTEKGITDKFTFGIKGSTQVKRQQQDTLVLVTDEGERAFPTLFNVSELEIWGRFLLSESVRSILSFQPLLKFPPLYTGEGKTGFNMNTAAGELRLLFGHSFPYKDRWHYINIEGAYREYFDGRFGETKLDLTLGSHISPKWEVLGQVFTSINARNFVTVIGQDSHYDQIKLQLSGVYHINDTNAIQLGVYGEPAGRRTGSGVGILLGIWKRF